MTSCHLMEVAEHSEWWG